MRFDLQVIASWIETNACVLDLGCGSGSLLSHLVADKDVRATGIEQDEEKVALAIGRGLSVLQGDISEELADYPDWESNPTGGFDYVVLSQTLQQVFEPAPLIREMLRVGRRGIVSFPNFSHWRVRTHLLLTGEAPRTRELPYDWHNSPNIRVITLKDFVRFCHENGFKVLDQVAIDTDYRAESGHIVTRFANWRASYGIFLLEGTQ